MAELRWGIMGTGDIARSMVACLRERGSPIVAVGSARPGAAAEFASAHDIPHAFDSHDAVAEHPEVDVVYVGTTNDKHLPNVLACVANQTPVLCEKPIALDADEATMMLDAAKATGVFAMEAMWMRFQPFLAELDALVASGAIGELRTIIATLGFSAPIDVDRRWLSRELGGGSILDLGVYPMTLIHHFAGSPVRFVCDGLVGPTGVDLEASVVSRHANDVSASWISTFRSDTPNEAIISGSDGRVRVSAPFHHSSLLTLERGGDVVDRFPIEVDVHGFEFQVAEAERCITEGLVESPVRPHRDTLAVMQWMDAIRGQVGVTYPSRKP